ncbi:MAG: hypothetical protein QNJ70_00025 [Xenococcaceae cyanobacterium MO_207.B15]|nr:hypothetical protein [Xenococcaceae cyanobacterium MO_207.B15]
MNPRQYDFTGNFFPRESHGTNVFENTHTPLYVWNFTDTTSVSNPFPSCQGALLCANLQQFLARFLALESIIQRLKPLVYKDYVSKLLSYRSVNSSLQ